MPQSEASSDTVPMRFGTARRCIAATPSPRNSTWRLFGLRRRRGGGNGSEGTLNVRFVPRVHIVNPVHVLPRVGAMLDGRRKYRPDFHESKILRKLDRHISDVLVFMLRRRSACSTNTADR